MVEEKKGKVEEVVDKDQEEIEEAMNKGHEEEIADLIIYQFRLLPFFRTQGDAIYRNHLFLGYESYKNKLTRISRRNLVKTVHEDE